MNRVVDYSRYLFVLAVFSAIVLALLLFFFGVVLTVDAVIDLIRDREFTPEAAQSVSFEAIEIVDFFLLATVFYIVALGLYTLFIDEDHPMPPWMHINDLDDLKHRLAGVVIVAMAVSFFGLLLSSDDPEHLLRIGVGIGAVIVALTYFMNSQSDHKQIQEASLQEAAQKETEQPAVEVADQSTAD